jgi:hypothetical protein
MRQGVYDTTHDGCRTEADNLWRDVNPRSHLSYSAPRRAPMFLHA